MTPKSLFFGSAVVGECLEQPVNSDADNVSVNSDL
jgi:hypothetical protein